MVSLVTVSRGEGMNLEERSLLVKSSVVLSLEGRMDLEKLGLRMEVHEERVRYFRKREVLDLRRSSMGWKGKRTVRRFGGETPKTLSRDLWRLGFGLEEIEMRILLCQRQFSLREFALLSWLLFFIL